MTDNSDTDLTDPHGEVAALRSEIARLTAERDAALAGPVKVKPLVWDGFVAGSYRIDVEKGGIANLWRYSAEMVENEEPELMQGGYLTLVSMDELKAYAQADYEARILAALEPQPITVQDAARVPEIAEIENGGKRWHGEDHRVVAVRWEPYKPDGQRQMKAKGRWQEQVGSGDFWRWQNCDRPAALRAIAGGR